MGQVEAVHDRSRGGVNASRRHAAHRDAPQPALLAQAAYELPRPEPPLEPAGGDSLRSRRRAPGCPRSSSDLVAERLHLGQERALSPADAWLVPLFRPPALLAHLPQRAGRDGAKIRNPLSAHQEAEQADGPIYTDHGQITQSGAQSTVSSGGRDSVLLHSSSVPVYPRCSRV